MGKIYGFFHNVADLAVALHDFSEVFRELVDQLKGLRMDLKEEQQHREAIYKLLMEAKVKNI